MADADDPNNGLGLTTTQYNLLVVWRECHGFRTRHAAACADGVRFLYSRSRTVPALILTTCVSSGRFWLARRLRWRTMVLRLTATHTDDTRPSILSTREREVLTELVSNLTLLAALGSALALSLLIAPTEVLYGPDSKTVIAQAFLFFSFASTATFVVVVIESSLTMLYLEQYNDAQLHALLCDKAADLFVEPVRSSENSHTHFARGQLSPRSSHAALLPRDACAACLPVFVCGMTLTSLVRMCGVCTSHFLRTAPRLHHRHNLLSRGFGHLLHLYVWDRGGDRPHIRRPLPRRQGLRRLALPRAVRPTQLCAHTPARGTS